MDENYEYLRDLGKSHIEAEKYVQAEKCFRKAITLCPGKSDAYVDLGNIYSALEQVETAQAYYEKALKLDNTSWRAWHNIGRIYRKQGSLKIAIEYFETALQHNPVSALCLTSLGTCCIDVGDMEKAEKYYIDAICAEPDWYGGRYSLAIHYKEQGKFKLAIDMFELLLDNTPEKKKKDVVYLLADSYYKLGDLGKAEEYYRLLNDVYHPDVYYVKWLAYLLNAQGKFNESIVLVRKSVSLYPENEELWNKWLWAEILSKDLDYLAQAVEKAHNQFPDSIKMSFNLATACVDLDEFDRAIDYMKNAEHLAPEAIEPQVGLAYLYYCISEKQQALRICEEIADDLERFEEGLSRTYLELVATYLEMNEEKILAAKFKARYDDMERNSRN